MVAHVRMSLRAQELQCQEGQQVVLGGDHLGPRQPSGSHDLVDLQLRQEWSEQEDPRSLALVASTSDIIDTDGFGSLGDLGATDGQPQLLASPAGKLRQALLGEHALHGAYRQFDAILGEQFDDFAA